MFRLKNSLKKLAMALYALPKTFSIEPDFFVFFTGLTPFRNKIRLHCLQMKSLSTRLLAG